MRLGGFLEGGAVGLESLEEGGLGSGVVGVVASPSFEGGALQRAGVGEGDWPGVGAEVGDGLEVVGGLLGGLAAREEDNAGEGFGDEFAEDFGGPVGDFFRGGLGLVLFAGEDHVDFENGGREVDFLAGELGEEFF